MNVSTLPDDLNKGLSIAELATHYTKVLKLGLVQLEPKSKGTYVTGWTKNPITDPEKLNRKGNIGLNHGYSQTAALDLDHVAAEYALKLVGISLPDILAEAPYQIVGNPEKPPKPLFRVQPGIVLSRKVLNWPNPDGRLDEQGVIELDTIFELRGGPGLQDVLPPSIHPDTGQPYRWLNDNIPQKPDDIPYLPTELLALWLAWGEKEYLFVCPWVEPAADDPPPTKAPTMHYDNNGFNPAVVSDEFNKLHSPAEIIERHGYKPVGHKWLSPHSSTGNPGVILLNDKQKILSFHASDALGDGRPHDAFDCYAILEHGGDRSAAWQAAKESLGIKFDRSDTSPPDGDSNGSDPAPVAGETDQDLPIKGDGRPWIQTNARHHREVSQDAYQALLDANDPPRVFVRSGRLTRIKLDEDGRPIADDIDPDALKYELDRAANFYTLSYNKTDAKHVQTRGSLQMAVVKDVMAYPQWPELPPLVNIVQYPVFSPDGTINTEHGYNAKTRTYYYKNQLDLGEIEFFGNVEWAKNLIVDDLLKDFPFVDKASRTHAIAALLLPFVRPLINGPTPLHIVDAPQFGTGKGKLCKAISIPSAPHGVSLITAPDNDEEWRKLIISTLMEAPSHILIDNIPEKLQSGVLAAVLTADSYTARMLGTMTNITAPNRAVWLGTGNNTSAHGELARRIVWIRLDAEMEKPWERKSFKHSNLESWAHQKRADLIMAAIILVKVWFNAGCPRSEKPLGSFDEWAAIIGGILENAGFDGFLGNADEMYERANADRLPWESFVNQWHDAYGFEPVGVKQLFAIASYYDPKKHDPENKIIVPEGLNLLGEFIDKPTDRARQTQLGALLRQNTDKIFGQYKIVKAGTKFRAAQYKLNPLKTLV